MDGIKNLLGVLGKWKGRLWLCKNGHALGIMVRVQDKGHFVTRLLLFREAFDLTKVDKTKEVVAFPEERKTMGFVEGTMYDIECSCCNEKKTWWMNRDQVIQLLAPLHQSKEKILM